MTGSSNIREVRILVDYRGSLRRICKVAVSKTDASIYILPYGREGLYFFGRSTIPGGKQQATVPFNDQETSDRTPKLSIHETGQVHIKAGVTAVGPMLIPALNTLRGNHVATIHCVHFDRLAPFDGQPSSTGSEQDHVIPADGIVESGRLAVCVNGREASFVIPARLTVTMQRDTLAGPLFVGFATLSERVVDDDGVSGGVVVASGWDPVSENLDDPLEYLFIVAK